MNAYEIAEVIAEYLVDNKELVIAMIKDNDKETLQDETDESNPFLKVLSDCEDCDDYCMITMFDETGMSYDVEIDSASDLMAMLVSVRLLSCEFIEEKTSIKSELDKGR